MGRLKSRALTKNLYIFKRNWTWNPHPWVVCGDLTRICSKDLFRVTAWLNLLCRVSKPFAFNPIKHETFILNISQRFCLQLLPFKYVFSNLDAPKNKSHFIWPRESRTSRVNNARIPLEWFCGVGSLSLFKAMVAILFGWPSWLIRCSVYYQQKEWPEEI